MKTCNKCGDAKTLECFRRDAEARDGHRGMCKDCTRLYLKSWAEQHAEEIREKRRVWRETHRPEVRAYARDWQRANGKVHHAHVVARSLARRRRASKPKDCQGCGLATDLLEKHHVDYARPLDVTWLCKPCHVVADVARKSLQVAS